MENRIDVLDKGYIILQDHMGSDLTPANAARVSYNKKRETMSEKDERLINFLAREGHDSPFRHATLQFEVYAPLMVARQWWKYVVGSSHQDNMVAWNESSRRYITEDPFFYIPDSNSWREAPENSKQGSGGPIDPAFGKLMTDNLTSYVEMGEKMYAVALEMGMAPEQARLFLPAYGMYVRWYWTASLQGVAHFLNQRMEKDSQWEIQQYANAVHQLASEKFPVGIEALRK